MQNRNDTGLISLFAALSISLGILENFLPMPLPGVRLGLANIGIMLAVYILGPRAAFTVAFIKALAVAVFGGGLVTKLSIGLPATIVSTAVMIIYVHFLRSRTTAVSTGAVGAFAHISVQFYMVKTLYVQSEAIYSVYFPFALFAVLTGCITGLITMRAETAFYNITDEVDNL